jgi:TPR repeat protein
MAAEQGNRDAQFHMGESYELGIFRGLQTDMNQAMSWYKKAAAQGHSGAAERLVILERKHGLYRRR